MIIMFMIVMDFLLKLYENENEVIGNRTMPVDGYLSGGGHNRSGSPVIIARWNSRILHSLAHQLCRFCAILLRYSAISKKTGREGEHKSQTSR